ncbi:MAG: hypothetical protein ACFNS5_06450, partial [Prevotella melaninogenica]
IDGYLFTWNFISIVLQSSCYTIITPLSSREGMGEGLLLYLPFCPNFSSNPFSNHARLSSKRRPTGLQKVLFKASIDALLEA